MDLVPETLAQAMTALSLSIIASLVFFVGMLVFAYAARKERQRGDYWQSVANQNWINQARQEGPYLEH